MNNINYFTMLEDAELQTDPSLEGQTAYLVRELLVSLGENPNREGLLRTPQRVERMFDELLSGYKTDLVTMVNGAVFQSNYRDMVLVKDIEFYSLCEHHLLPFFGHAHVAYVPDGKIIGLSKIPRLVEMFAHRLQIQERLTEEIADALNHVLQPKGVAVVVEASHMCAMMRGVKKAKASMITKSLRGIFQTNEKVQRDFLAFIQRNGE